MKTLLNIVNPRAVFALLGVGAIGIVFLAGALTTLLHLNPCPLCIFQRVLYLIAGASLLVAAGWPRFAFWAVVPALLAFAGSLATASYQSWMQAFPARFAQCGFGVPTNPIEKLVDWLGQLWPWMFYGWGDCASREWELFGLSLANWSAVASLALMAVVAVALYRSLKPVRA